MIVSPSLNLIKGNQNVARGGKRDGAGRKVGAVTRLTREEAEKAIDGGKITPLAYMIGILDGTYDMEPNKFEAAKAAAPYVHAKLASVESKVTGSLDIPGIDRPPNETREQWIERRKRELAAAAMVASTGAADRSH